MCYFYRGLEEFHKFCGTVMNNPPDIKVKGKLVTQLIDHYVCLSSVASIHDRHVQRKHNDREKWERWVLSEHDLDLDLWPWYPGRNLDTSFLNVLENMITLRPVTAVFCRVGDRICPKHIEYIRILRILRLSRTDVDSDFCCLCRHLLDFSNGTWPTFDQLHREYGGSPRINLAPLDFEYSALLQVYTFFWWRL